MEPLTEEGLWLTEQATMRSEVYVNSLHVPTEWGDADTSRSLYALNGKFSRFTGLVGIQDGGNSTEAAVFQVLLDGRPEFEAEVRIGEEPVPIDIATEGVGDLELVVVDISNSMYAAQAVFADLTLS